MTYDFIEYKEDGANLFLILITSLIFYIINIRTFLHFRDHYKKATECLWYDAWMF